VASIKFKPQSYQKTKEIKKIVGGRRKALGGENELMSIFK
jgi:hypothetical protein